MLRTELIVDGGDRQPARIRDLSAGGVKLQFDGRVAELISHGASVMLEIRGIGLVRGTIAWSRGDWAGVRFDQEIDPDLARRPVGAGPGTPDFVKPVIVPSRRLKNTDGL